MSSEPRKQLKRHEHPNQCRFLTFSCRHRLPLLGKPEIRDSFVVVLNEQVAQSGVELIAWVVMPEHVHLVVVPPVNGSIEIASWLKKLKQSHGMRVLKKWRQLQAPILERITEPDGRLKYWQPGGGFDRNIRDHEELLNVVEYIHSNPVKRGLVDRQELWRWSSIHRHLSEPVPVRGQ